MLLTTTSPKHLRTSTISSKGKGEKTGNGALASIYLCATCTSPVKDGEKGLICDFCGKYTHLLCDGKLSTEVYTALETHCDNSIPAVFLYRLRTHVSPKKHTRDVEGVLRKHRQ